VIRSVFFSMQATVASIPGHGNIRYEIHISSPAGSHSHSHPYMLSLCPWVSIIVVFNPIPVNQWCLINKHRNNQRSKAHSHPFPRLAVLADGLVSLSSLLFSSLLFSPLLSLIFTLSLFSSLPFPSSSSSTSFPFALCLLSGANRTPQQNKGKTFYFLFSVLLQHFSPSKSHRTLHTQIDTHAYTHTHTHTHTHCLSHSNHLHLLIQTIFTFLTLLLSTPTSPRSPYLPSFLPAHAPP